MCRYTSEPIAQFRNRFIPGGGYSGEAQFLKQGGALFAMALDTLSCVLFLLVTGRCPVDERHDLFVASGVVPAVIPWLKELLKDGLNGDLLGFRRSHHQPEDLG